MNRSDITDWIIHFVHKRNPDNDPAIWNIDPDTDERLDFPDYFDNEGNWKIIFNKDSDEEFYITPDAPAFSVLKKIIHDGYLKSGWSFRKDVPTIYGNRSAVCFTEMPLHGLIEYVKKRGKKYADTYGIAFKKNELFNAGGRPVIYGLSTQHLEEEDKKTIGLRNLSATKTGIGLIEQYRYVATSFSNNKTIDWTHEREWRWALPDDRYGVAGLPFILDPDDYANFFSDIIIIVNTKDEVDNIFLQLKNQKDSGSTNYGFGYNIDLIKKLKSSLLNS